MKIPVCNNESNLKLKETAGLLFGKAKNVFDKKEIYAHLSSFYHQLLSPEKSPWGNFFNFRLC